MRRVIRRHRVHHAGRQRRNAGVHIGPRAQRRVDLRGGVVAQLFPATRHRRMIQPDVVRRHLRGHPQPAPARPIDRLQRRRRREVAAVQRRARRLGQRDVALDDAQLGQRRLPAQAQPRRDHPVVHHPARGEQRIFAVLRQRDVEVGQILERPPRDPRVGHRVAVVADRDRAGLAQRRQLGQLAPLPPDGDRADRQHPRVCAARPIDHARHHRRGIDRRLRIGHRADRREAAPRRRRRAAGDRLLVLFARRAQMRVQIHKPRRDHQPRRVELGFARAGGERRAQLDDPPRADAQVQRRVEPRRGIDHAPAAHQRVPARLAHDAPRTSRNSTAIRIASPAETCASIRLCAPCATSEVISTPSFIGPGCITSACGAADATRSAVSW